MARRWQRERTIQRVAVAWLAQRFAEQNRSARVCYREEARVDRSGRYWGRADGLIAVLFRDGETHTVALEAKSMRTRSAMRGDIGFRHLAVGGLLPGTAVGSMMGWEIVPRIGACVGSALALLAGGVAGFLFLLGLDALRRLDEHAVLRQVMRYPAGERWLVLPIDYHRQHEHLFDDLKIACERKGVGLLTVDRRENVVVEWEAGAAGRRDMLDLYKDADALRDALGRTAPGTAARFEK